MNRIPRWNDAWPMYLVAAPIVVICAGIIANIAMSL
jgi:hypothetical protein